MSPPPPSSTPSHYHIPMRIPWPLKEKTMTPVVRNLLLAGLALLLGATAARAQDPPAKLTKEQAAKAYAAASDMIGALYRLQDVIADYDITEQKRGLYKQAGGVVEDLMAYKKFLFNNAPRDDLYFEFGKIEVKFRGLMDTIDGLGPVDQPIKRAAQYVRAADNELHNAV